MAQSTPFGLYVHWPYCTRLCPYCDFNIYRNRDGNHDDLLDAIVADIEGHGRRITAPGPLQSLSFGGGTPSLMRPEQIAAVIDAASRVFGFVDDPEISLEANPDALSAPRCQGFAAAGINRLSIGVQSLDDQELKFLGRDHSAKEARNAITAAQNADMRISADFIYDLPDQSEAIWDQHLKAALALELEHYSFYALTIEPNTAFGVQVKKGRMVPAPEERSAALYDLTQARTQAAGLPAYEVSNHARTIADQSRHNLVYWKNGDWIGVGPGAHGRAIIDGQRMALVSAKRPGDYNAAVQAKGWGIATQDALIPEDVVMEAFSMGLRLRAGLDLARLQNRTGFVVPPDKLQSLIEDGWLEKEQSILRVRPKGWALIDRLVLELLT